MTPSDQLETAFRAAVKAAQPAKQLAAYLPPPPKGRLVVVGAGKAAAAMAQAVEAHYAHTPLSGLVITRYAHALPTQHVEVVEASHPVPDAAGVAATKRILELCQTLQEDDLLLCLISGGGSALLCAPAGITLQQNIQLTKALLASGATIQEMNVVRKHLSKVKGGQLAAATAARVLTLIVSDVVGDDSSSIASGPSVPDPSTYAEALELLNRYGVRMPDVTARLERGLRGELAETPKANHPAFKKTQTHIIASAQHSLAAAQRYFESQGIRAHILSDSVTGEAREVAKVHAALAKQIRRHAQPFKAPCVLLSGGETTVTVRDPKHVGKGGRNCEFALSLACELAGLAKVYALAADTDGIDGSEDNAGAFITPDMLTKLALSEARAYLHKHDSYSFFESADSLFVTGPTHTNVNDLRMIFIED